MKTIQEEKRTRQKAKGNGNGRSSPKGGGRTEEKLLSIDDRELQNYVKYCSEILREYFGAVRKNMRKYWDDDTSKLLSVISLNGFIIALTRQLSVNGVQDFDFYDQVFSRWSFDFSSEKFPYTSSQYRKFSNEILENAFDIPKETLETI